MSTTKRTRTTLALLALLPLAALALACGDLFGPEPSGDVLYIVDDGVIWELDTGTGAMDGRVQLGGPTGSRVVARGGAAYAETEADDGAVTLWRVDLCRMTPEWSLDLGRGGDPAVHDGIALGHGTVGVSGDGERLFVAGSSRNDSSGIAVLDARTRAVVGFIGPFHSASARDAGPVAGFDGDVALVTGQREDHGPWTLFFLDAATLEALDSVAPESVGGSPILSARHWGDGRSLVLYGFDLMLRYDVADRAVVGRREVVAVDWALSPEPRVVAIDHRSDQPGILRVLGPDLEVVAEIDIRIPLAGDPDRLFPPAVRWLRISRDGTRVYVGSGVADGVFSGERARVTVVDLDAGTVVTRIEVGGVGHPGYPIIPPSCR